MSGSTVWRVRHGAVDDERVLVRRDRVQRADRERADPARQLRRAEDRRLRRRRRVAAVRDLAPRRAAIARSGVSRTDRCSCRRCSRGRSGTSPEPSTKNGRRSEKNVSNADRFTSAGSASTWPKSGLTVPVSVSPGRSAYFRSTPTVASGSARFDKRIAGLDRLGLDVAADVRHDLETLRRSIEPQPGQLAERRHVAVRALRQQRPGRRLVQPADLRGRSPGRTSKSSDGRNRNCENGNAELGAPAALRARDADVPHRIPALIVVVVVEPVAYPA